MKVNVVGIISNGELQKIKKKGCEEVDFEVNDIVSFSTDKQLRLIGFGMDIYKLTLKSYKQVKKELEKRGRI